MRLATLLIVALLAAPAVAVAGIDNTNHYVSFHSQEVSGSITLDVRFRVHCQPVMSGSPCGASLLDTESGPMDVSDFQMIKAGAQYGGWTQTDFDNEVAAVLGSWYTGRTTAEKSVFYRMVKEMP